MQLILDQITKSFGTKEVLKGASYTFEQGKIYGLLGRNGSGKTTLFNCLSAEFPADGGEVTLVDEYGQSRTPKQGDIGYVLSTPVVQEMLTGIEFVKFFQEIAGDKRGPPPEQWLDLGGLGPAASPRLMRGYSHGMKHKIQMLCFLTGKPPVILLDEPLTSFDVVAALEMKNLLREMKEDHIILFSTHILQLAQDLCDEIVLLSHGELEVVEKSNLDDHAFKEKIIAALKEESYA